MAQDLPRTRRQERLAAPVGKPHIVVAGAPRPEAQHLVDQRAVLCAVRSAPAKRARSSIRATPSPATPSAGAASASHCERRYTTYERVEESPLVVVKRSGGEELFTRGKLLNGLLRACEKRGIALERIERIVDEIEGELRRESVPGSRRRDRRAGVASPACARQGRLHPLRVGVPAVRRHRRVPARARQARRGERRPAARRAAAPGIGDGTGSLPALARAPQTR